MRGSRKCKSFESQSAAPHSSEITKRGERFARRKFGNVSVASRNIWAVPGVLERNFRDSLRELLLSRSSVPDGTLNGSRFLAGLLPQETITGKQRGNSVKFRLTNINIEANSYASLLSSSNHFCFPSKHDKATILSSFRSVLFRRTRVLSRRSVSPF